MAKRRLQGNRAMPARLLERRRRLFKRGLYLLDRRFLRRPHQYMLQALLAALTLSVLVAVEDFLANAATATAVASSAFIVFMAPHAAMSGPRRVLGGHTVGLAVGLVAFLLVESLFTTVVAKDLTAAFAVGISMLVMAGTDTEHPPAAGTVLSLVLADDVLEPAVVIIVAAIALTLARQFLRRWMIDLAH